MASYSARTEASGIPSTARKAVTLTLSLPMNRSLAMSMVADVDSASITALMAVGQGVKASPLSPALKPTVDGEAAQPIAAASP